MEQLDFTVMALQFAKNHTILVVAWIAIFIMVIYQSFKALTSKVKAVDNAQLTQLINEDDAAVIDLRTLDEFKRGHIINSLQVLPAEIKAQNIGKIAQHKERPVIIVDANGIVSNNAANELIKQGFARVYVLKEGIAGWINASLPLVKH